MPTINSIQAEMTAAIICGILYKAARVIVDDGLAPERRLAIHRHHYVITLVAALGDTFPVTRRLLGERTFAHAAERFICVEPPAAPCLFEYGEGFAAFLASDPSAGMLAYIGDVVRFEWAINRAYHAPDGAPPPPPSVADERAGNFVAVVAPHVGLIESPHPVEAIWQANQQEDVPRVSFDRGGDRLVVFRRGLDVRWRRLEPGEAVLLADLVAGRPLAFAFDRSAASGADFDPAAALASFAAEGFVLGFVSQPAVQEVPS